MLRTYIQAPLPLPPFSHRLLTSSCACGLFACLQISEEAFARVDHKSLSQALEAAMEQAFKKAADFYEETFAE